MLQLRLEHSELFSHPVRLLTEKSLRIVRALQAPVADLAHALLTNCNADVLNIMKTRVSWV